MSLRAILDALRTVPLAPRPAARRAAFRPRLEPLGDRWVPSFNPAVPYAAGANPAAVVAADFDGDGVLDLAVANNGGSTISLLRGNGDGTFQPAVDSATGTGPLSVAVGDFDGNGKLDLATANSSDVSVLLGNGDGTFAAPASVPLSDGSSPQSVAVGDFNADGKMDLGVASNLYQPGYYYTGWYGYLYWQPGYYDGTAHVLIGDGLGGFSDTGGAWLGNGYQWSAAVADLTGDGNMDFAGVGPDNGAAAVLAGNGLGGLSWPTNYYTGGAPLAVAAGDVNGDGKTDLVASGAYNTVGVLPGDGLGGFGPLQTYATGSYPVSVALADFNADGRPDIATANYSGGDMSVLLSRANGTFTPAINSAAGSNPWGVAAGDFNADGWPDAATANYYGGDASVLVNDHAWTPADAPTVGVGDVTVTEGNTGSVSATFTLTLSAAYGQPVTVHFVTADGGATAGSDYTAGSADVTIPAGQTTQTFTVAVLGDRLPESTEYFFVNLSGATNAFVGDGQGVGTILDNEPRISVNDVTVTEGNTGSVNATVTVRLSVAYDEPVTVHFDTANGTATAGSDYTAASGDVTVAAGQTSQTFTVAVLGDRAFEPTETFAVNLSSPSSNALISDAQGIVYILDDEPRIAINDVRKNEGNGNGKNNSTPFTFTISLSAAYDQAVTVNYATADGTAKVSDNDYVAASGSVTFAPGETSKTITVSVKPDKKLEADEWFAVNLSGASSNALIADSTGIGWILNDDH